MKISIIGAGNGGQATAGHLSLLGHEVTLYNRNIQKFKNFAESKTIILQDKITGNTEIKSLTDNMQVAVQDAELIMVTTTANAHKQIAKQVAPYVQENQIIVLSPGRTLGALEFSNELRKSTDKRVYVAETQSLVYACRADSPGVVRIIGVKDKVLLAAYPSIDTEHVINKLNAIYNCFIKADSTLTTGLENIGAILHPTIVLLNAAVIERGESFYFYNDVTPTIADFIVEVDKERLKIGDKLGIKLNPVSEWVSFAYSGVWGDGFCEKIQNNPAYNKIMAPTALESRYLLEDIPTGILPLVELARMVEVEVPLLSSVLQISEKLLKKNFTQDGRTLQNLGINTLTPDELQAKLRSDG